MRLPWISKTYNNSTENVNQSQSVYDYYQALSYGVGYGVVHKRGLEEIFVNPSQLVSLWVENIKTEIYWQKIS